MERSKGAAKLLQVTVCIEDDPTNYPPDAPYKYWLETEDNNGGKKKGNALSFKNEVDGKKYNGYDITFDLDDRTGKGFKFMDAKKLPGGGADPDCAPMWVKEVENFVEPCPHRQFWDQFYTVSVSGNNTKLHVRNENDCVQKFKFALMFSRNPRQAPFEIMYDPDGTNGNGQKPSA